MCLRLYIVYTCTWPNNEGVSLRTQWTTCLCSETSGCAPPFLPLPEKQTPSVLILRSNSFWLHNCLLASHFNIYICYFFPLSIDSDVAVGVKASNSSKYQANLWLNYKPNNCSKKKQKKTNKSRERNCLHAERVWPTTSNHLSPFMFDSRRLTFSDTVECFAGVASKWNKALWPCASVFFFFLERLRWAQHVRQQPQLPDR